jgi:CRISPR-associated endonuclease/helicase Cas3
MMYYAHTAKNENGELLPEYQWQPLKDHLANVARLAKAFGAPLGLGDEAEVAGFLHDLGKYRQEFQDYLRGKRPGGPDTQHAIFGAAWALEHAAQDNTLLGAALSVAGHHAGLHNLADLPSLAESPPLHPLEASRELLRLFTHEHAPLPKIPHPRAWVKDELSIDVYTRLVFSCLIDADRTDTALWPRGPLAEKPLDAEHLLELVVGERDRKSAGKPGSLVQDLRNRVFDACLERAQLPQGFFSMTVPTGGGKTLSSMAFALAHAQSHRLRRVIVVIPYLSIIEQNAAEYRRIFGDALVLENHSAVQPPLDRGEEEKSRLDLIAENWDSPIVVTTSVQFLESLFTAAPSRCRKLHRIPRSVVIFDEVQTLPTHLLAPVFSVLRELQQNYGVSFVFCSATQPAFRRAASLPADFFAANELREIAPDPPALFRELRRVVYHLPAPDEVIEWSELAERLAGFSQVLCVVNLTRHAATLWDDLNRRLPDTEKPIHLSAAMCPQHRLDLIYEIRERLSNARPCRVISTQLIEAGVDVDFPVVWRALGPLDSIVQVAGRCNREGRQTAGDVHVFRPVDHKLPPGIYRAASDLASVTLASVGQSPQGADRLGTDPQLFADYFQSLYQAANTDHARRGESSIQEDRTRLRFREVAGKAKVIKDEGQPVIVSFGAARALVDEIRARVPQPGQPRFSRDDLHRLQRFMVNVHTHKFQVLLGWKQIKPLLPNLELYVLDDGLYHSDLGIVIDNRPLGDFLQ